MTLKEKLLTHMEKCNTKGREVYIRILTPDCPRANTTIHPHANLEAMSKFYSNAYTDDLVHAMNKSVKIIDWW